MGNLFLARHSITDASASGRNAGQASDPPLTAAGHDLALRLGEAIAVELSELPHDEPRLLSSPARRCRQTAEAVAGGVGIELDAIELEPGLHEIDYGAWEGLTAAECRSRDPELRAAWERDPYATACPGGESGAQVADRSFPIFERLEGWLAEDRARCSIVIAHNHVNRLRLCALMGWPRTEYRVRIVQNAAGYSLVTFGERLPVVRRLNASPA
ncbi:MAG: histidine phosphatase family protein [Candidatus Limnocylindria bacterium]